MVSPLPNFIIAGERRCGTTSLVKNLSHHPQIFAHPKQDKSWFIEDSVRKKPDFSPWETTHNIDDYSRWFAEESPPQNTKMGEKSADYLFWGKCHKRLSSHLPETKFIFVLRDPIKRAWSHYWNEVAKGREKLTFTEAIHVEAERIKKDDYHLYNFSYASRGFYSRNLQHFFKYIAQDRCLIIPVEQIWKSPKQELARVCRFLEVDDTYSFPEEKKAFNSNWAVFPKEPYRHGAGRFVAQIYDICADSIAKLTMKNRRVRREKLIKWKSPFFEAARDLQIPKEAQDFLLETFKDEKKQLTDLTGINLDLWKT